METDTGPNWAYGFAVLVMAVLFILFLLVSFGLPPA